MHIKHIACHAVGSKHKLVVEAVFRLALHLLFYQCSVLKRGPVFKNVIIPIKMFNSLLFALKIKFRVFMWSMESLAQSSYLCPFSHLSLSSKHCPSL